ncbi:MAG: transporter substrate-binding protein, partial [Frankiales bacterium]|nr:transporter substrate-binding protein [Frankiales bacterium]
LPSPKQWKDGCITMRRHGKVAAGISLVAVAALVLTACSSSKKSSSDNNSASGSSSNSAEAGVAAAYNAANDGIVNASTKTGGTVTYEDSDTPDSFDPGNTYYAWVWDMSRLWARSLTTFKPAAGKDGLTLVPDLATSLGVASDGGKTWTYHIRAGLKYSNGAPITTADVKYAIERSNYAPDVLSNGPTYFNGILVNNTPAYAGPYKDKSATGLKSIETPDATTIIFHLNAPFADFDYLTSNPQTAPVPQASDTGATYVNHIVSSGPYMFSSYTDGKGATLVPNPNWTKASDPIRNQNAGKITYAFAVDQNTIDSDLIAENATADSAGAGVAASSQTQILTDPTKKANADDALSGALAYMAINTTVAPFNNLQCRVAIEYAVDKTSVQTVLGGPVRGDIASTVLPPNITGYTNYNLYPTDGNKADTTKAKAALTACGKPGGFSTSLSARSDRPNEIAAATAIQAALKTVGINVTIQQYPSGKYFSDYAGAPAFAKAHDLGLLMTAWGADWPTGYGFLQQIIDGGSIKASGNSNVGSLNDPAIKAALKAANENTDTAARTTAWGDIDKMVMKDAAIVPLVYRKDLLYRPTTATNVTVSQAYGMYDYLLLGSSS